MLKHFFSEKMNISDLKFTMRGEQNMKLGFRKKTTEANMVI